MSIRMEKVNQEIRRQITAIIRGDIDDPAVDFMSITRVETTPDLRESKVYFSLLDESKLSHVQRTLNSMGNFIRRNLGKRVRIKILPRLKFIADTSIRYSVDIYRKIEEVRLQDEANRSKTERGAGDD